MVQRFGEAIIAGNPRCPAARSPHVRIEARDDPLRTPVALAGKLPSRSSISPGRGSGLSCACPVIGFRGRKGELLSMSGRGRSVGERFL